MSREFIKGFVKWSFSFLQYLCAMAPVWLASEAMKEHNYPHTLAYICLFVWVLVFQYLDKAPVRIEIIHKGDNL